ncbi:hypothetical protein GQ457_07G045570 [Hibiscus cannabinus]
MAIMPENFFTEADKGNISRNWLRWKEETQAILPDPFRSLNRISSFWNHAPGHNPPTDTEHGFCGLYRNVANLHTAELRSIWLARYVSTRGIAFRRLGINHSDEICEEMGWEFLEEEKLVCRSI